VRWTYVRGARLIVRAAAGASVAKLDRVLSPKAGRYRLVVTATDSARNRSLPRSTAFRVLG